MSDQTGVVAVLERMRVQADYGRCMDSNFVAKVAIQHIDEDRAALNAVAKLIAAVEEYYAAEAGLGRHANGPMTQRLQRYYDAEKGLAAALQACKGGA